MATLIKKDIFKNLMWYVLPDSSKQYPLTIERVKKIRSLNSQGIVVDELEAVEVVSTKPKEVEPEFVDVVGQISLKSLERNDKKKRDRGREQRNVQQQKPPQAGALPPPKRQQQQPPNQQQRGPQQRPQIRKGPQGKGDSKGK